MVIKTSGPLSFSEIQAEFGGSHPISLSEYYNNGSQLGGECQDPNTIPNSGNIITVFDFYGASRLRYFTATGGSISTSGDFKIHTFTNSGTFRITQNAIGNGSSGEFTVNYICIGGGGGGGSISGGGGGGGDWRTGSFTGSARSYSIGVGGVCSRSNTTRASTNGANTPSGRGGTSSIANVVSSIGGGGGGTCLLYTSPRTRD